MNNTHGTEDSRKARLGNRSMSLGAALKERRAERELAGAPEIEYELGNGDLGGPDSETDDVSEEAPSGRRVVMVYDEDGKATPMPMARFYYDNVQAGESDDEEDDTKGHEVLDTVRSNIPAPFSGRDDNFSDSGSSNEDKSDLKPMKVKGMPAQEGTFVEDAEDYEYEDEVEDCEDDRFKNQFMRIQIPTAQLKDVSRVKKDLDHDKPHRRRSLRVCCKELLAL